MKTGKKNKRSAPDNARSGQTQLSPRRRWIFRLVLLVFPFCILGLIEACLRVAGYGYDTDFFKRVTIQGKEYFVQNEDFSFRFFPPSMVRNPGPVRFPVHKAPGTFRIFIFGESAAMGDPAESFAPDRYLERLLSDKYPRTRFEIINTAVTAIDSHVILPIARECASHEGDLWIIYMGNNEMIGPYGAATVFGLQAPPLAYVRLTTAVQKLRLAQWIKATGMKLAHGSQGGAAWGGMEMFMKNQIAPGSPARERVYGNFQRNLDDIVNAGLDSGAKVLLNTVGVNLRDCPPFASLHGHALTAAENSQFSLLYSNSLQAFQQGEWSKAADGFSQAARMDDEFANLQYYWAGCYLAQTNLPEAEKHFQLACDDDALPFRTDTRLNDIIQSEPQRKPGKQLILCDAAKALAEGSSNGICGDETFLEHVHFDFDGRYRLARAWADQIESLLPQTTNTWISQTECEKELGLSPWNRGQVLHLMVERMQLPPLSSQANNNERKAVLESRIKTALAQAGREETAANRKEFEELLARRPEDFFVRENYAVFLELTGDVPAASAQWERYRDLVPQDPLGYFEAGRLLIPQKQYAEAESLLQRSLAIRPSRTDGWIELGNSLALQQKYAAALDCYAVALKQGPRDPQTLMRRGKALSHLNRHEEAIASYHDSLELNPADGLCHHELAMELAESGHVDEAGSEFRQSAQIDPNSVMFRYDYGTWLLRKESWLEAQQEFEAVVRLDPRNDRAQKHLDWLRARISSSH